MGMQAHFDVKELEEANLGIEIKKEGDEKNQDYFIIVNDNMSFNTDKEHKSAWFDIGQMSPSAMNKLKWLIQHRICFNAS